MAKITATKDYEIRKELGWGILEGYFIDALYDTYYVDEEETICFEDLSIKNSIIFLEELKKQLINAMDEIIKKYKQTEIEYGNAKLNYCEVMRGVK